MPESKSRVTVHSTLTVVSDKPVKPGKSYPLSVLDHAMGFHTLHIVFYYRYNRLESGDSSDLGRLRESLSEVLSYYPPVTGRLLKDDNGNWEVKYNDAGVRTLKAKVDCSLDEWLKSANGNEERDLTVWEDMPEETKVWSPYRIQMNDFEGGGLAIGLSCPHMQADPTCATTLMKSWTEMYRRIAISHPPFFHPPSLRGRTNPNTNTISVQNYEAKSRMETPTNVKMSTVTFRFSDTIIKKCLLEIQSKCPNATPFDMLAALFWSSVTNAKSPSSKQVSLSIGMDFRKRMHAPLPHGYFGNALHFSSVSTDQSKMEEGGLDYMTQIIHDHLSSIVEEEYWSIIDWLESKKQEGGKHPPPFQMYGPELTCANLEHVSAFAAVLDDKKPVHVSYHIGNVEGEGLILVLPSPEEGFGRTVMVTLPEDQTDKLCKDPAILRLEPTMLISGRL
ncbi:hypothetical protein AQUCO_04900147v1 [Aquilegia coerulea]|uniref:Uncharacterized protein n=1 Tax=Aquilegia coerulea TaxID=218851 RepID=A0A2G5CK34_AQUCA|nr:hypothetical protein AQUCO_04900147v1 [Aquilegia coerulea]